MDNKLKKDNKTKILIAGHCSLDPLGRHIISFLKCLLQDNRNEIYIEKSYLLGDTKTLEEFFKEELEKKLIKFDTNLPYDTKFDFLIFTDSLSLFPGQGWEYRLIKRNAHIKICYPVFDGSIPPLHWISVINKNFDICLCTSDYCSHNLKRYGVRIDCFCLECGVLIDDYLKISQKTSKKEKKFRFGSIGASDFRKNLPLLMESFSSTFKKDDNVELFIHSSYGKDLTCDNEIEIAYKKYSKYSNIILQTKRISHKEMIDLWSSFDAYISPQTTTGYFTTPLEACAVGIPTILSDIHPHKELEKFIPPKDNLFYVKHSRITPAFHWVFDYQILGCKFEGDKNEYIKVLNHVHSNRNKLNTVNLVNQRKTHAEKLSFLHLSKKYNNLIHPEKIFQSKHSRIQNDAFYMSKKLAKKYSFFNKAVLTSPSNLYKEIVYPEENLEIFKVIEKCAIDNQKIFLRKLKFNAPDLFLNNKWQHEIFRKAKKYSVTQIPYFIYKLFSAYCKFKHLLSKIK